MSKTPVIMVHTISTHGVLNNPFYPLKTHMVLAMRIKTPGSFQRNEHERFVLIETFPESSF